MNDETRSIIHPTSYAPLTVGQLRKALEGLHDDLPVTTGYYSCHGVDLIMDGGRFVALDIANSE